MQLWRTHDITSMFSWKIRTVDSYLKDAPASPLLKDALKLLSLVCGTALIMAATQILSGHVSQWRTFTSKMDSVGSVSWQEVTSLTVSGGWCDRKFKDESSLRWWCDLKHRLFLRIQTLWREIFKTAPWVGGGLWTCDTWITWPDNKSLLTRLQWKAFNLK